jgi:hypothetical protein
MIVIKNVYGGCQVFIKNVFANAENIVVVYNGGEPITVTGGGGGSGDVVGPASATDNAIVRFNLTTGKLIQNSGATIDDSGNITANNISGTNTGDQDLSGKSDVGHTHAQSDITNLVTDLSGKQATLVSGTNIKTINSSSILGSGDLVVGQSVYSLTQSALNELGAGFITQTFDVNLTTTTGRSAADNRIDFYVVYVPIAQTITGVKWIQQTQGVYTGDNYNGWGLYSYSGGTLTLVASSTNDSEIWKGAGNSAQTKAFSSPYSAAAGVYFVAWLYCQSAQTTAPTIAAKATLQAGSDGFLTNSAKISSSLSAQTSLPASTAASSLSTHTGLAWAALY